MLARARRAFTLLCLLVALGALGGMGWTAAETDRRLQLATNAGLARGAADFLTVVTPPGAIGEFDPVRLLSAANALASASFWPGGMQVVIGNTPLVPDSVALLPLPDSTLLAMEQGRALVVAQTPVVRAVFVPLLSREGHHTGAWVAVWNGYPVTLLGAVLRLVMLAVGIGAILMGLLSLWGVRSRARWLMAAGTGLGLLLLTVVLNHKVEATVRAATALRLETIRRLVEIAATAPGVRQATVPGVAASVTVQPLSSAPKPGSVVVWSEDSAGAFATILAATPRTLSGMGLSLRLVDPDPEQIERRLWGWCGLGLAMLLLITALSGLSSHPAVFHSGASESPRTTSSGTG